MRAIQLTISRIGLLVFQLIYPKTFFGEFSSFEEAEKKSRIRSNYSSDQEILENYNQIARNENTGQHLYLTESKRYSIQRFNFLPTLLAGMNLEEIHILDIGSGLIGIGRTIELTVTNLHAKVTNYDLPTYAKIAQLNPKNIPNLNFIGKISDAKDVDLVYFGNSLQYFNDWQSILRAVTEFNPRYIVISDTTFSNSKTFCTLQKNLSRSVIPRWIFQEEEMSTLMSQLRYKKKLETNNFSPIWNLKGRNLQKPLFQKNIIYIQET